MGVVRARPKSFRDSGFEFLLIDLDVALTLMDVADTTSSEERAQLIHQKARTAYDTVLRLLPKLHLDEAQIKTLDEKLALVRARLIAAGQRF
jgi:hypothetical protein